MDVFQATPEAFSKLDPALKSAARFAKNTLTPAGWVATSVEIGSGIADDRDRGLSWDDAIVNNVGGKGVEMAGGIIGGVSGAYGGAQIGRLAGVPAAAVGSVVGGLIGKYEGEERAKPAARQLLPRYQAAKSEIKKTTEDARQLLKKLQVLGTDRYYIDQSNGRRRLTDREY